MGTASTRCFRAIESAYQRISNVRLSFVHAAAEPLVAEAAHLSHDGQQRLALRRERVLDAWRRLGIALTRHDAFRLEPAQPLGERSRADPGTGALELGE